MSLYRLALTGAVMAVAAVALTALTPSPAELVHALGHPQATVDAAGADALVVVAAGAAAWGVWAWGALGLALTALSAAPGALGRAAELLLARLLPAGARRTAALALGLGLGLTAPVVGWLGPVQAAVAAPLAAGPTVPDWPTEPEAPSDTAAHAVVRGDCLWDIAAHRLRAAGATPTDAEIAVAVEAWWSANTAVIGPDPDLIFPGQVLQVPPPAPTDPSEESR